MANQFIPLPAPAADGPGPAVDVSTFGLLKTITYLAPAGTFPFKPTVIIEFSNEFVPVNFAPLAVIGQPNEIVIPVAAHWMRVTVANYKGGGAPIVNVGGNDLGASFVTLVAPPGSGAGAGVDTSSLGATKTIHVATAFRGVLNIEISEDGGATYNQVASFYGPGHKTLSFSADFMRATRAGVPQSSPGTPIINVGAVSDGNAGIIVEDEGVALGLFATMNFVGAGVTATDVGGVATITIPGGAAGAGTPNTIAKWTAPAVLGDSLLVDTGATLSYAGGAFAVDAATGATSVGGLLIANADISLTGAFTANGTLSNVNGQVLQVIAGVPQWGALSTAGGVTGTGTAGTYAMFTGASTIGNSTFPISQTSATALTIGDDQAADLTTFNGQLALTSTNQNSASTFTWTPVAGTFSGTAAVKAFSNGSFDTTGGVKADIAIYGLNTATKAGGAPTLTNYGIRGAASGSVDINYGVQGETAGTGTTNAGVRGQATGAGTTNYGGDFTATGATTNVALRTVAGDVYLNSTSGSVGIGYASGAALPSKLSVTGNATITTSATLNSVSGTTTIGFSNATASALTLSGQAIHTFTGSTVNANTFTWTPVAGTTSGLRAVDVVANGTYDTTGAAKSSTGILSVVSSTRSAGANNLQNIAIVASASGAQVNSAFRSNDGDNYLNTVSGSTGVGYGFSVSLPSKLSVTGDATITTSAALNTVSGTTTIGFASGTSAALNVIGNTTLFASGTQVLTASSSTVTATSTRTVITATRSGSSDATAADRFNYGVSATVSSTRSAGANNVYDIALYGTASGAQINVGVQTDAGDNYFHTTSGSSGFGYALGASLSAKLDVKNTSLTQGAGNFVWTPVASTTTALAALKATSNGTLDATAGALTSIAGSFANTSTRSAGANNLTNVGLQATASGAQVNTAFQTVDGNVLLNSTSGTTTIGFSNTTASALSVSGSSTFTASSQTIVVTGVNNVNGAAGNRTIFSASRAGDSNATATDRFNYGVNSTVSSTRSAGANNVINTALYGTATGGQINIGLQTDDGANYLNTTSGSLGVGYASGATLPSLLSVNGNATMLGDVTIGTNGSNSHTINGKTTITENVSNNGNALSATYSGPSGSSQRSAIVGTNSGTTLAADSLSIQGNNSSTLNATAADRTAYGMKAVVTATRSSGANNVINTALYGTATGGQINIGLQTDDGDVKLNTVSGTTTIGFSTSTATALAISGGATVTVGGATGNALNIAHQSTVVTTDRTAILGNRTGSSNATGADRFNYGVRGLVSSSRSSGANNVINTALYGTATGGQINIGLQTDAGDNYLNATSGSTGVGYASGAALPAKFSVTGAITLTTDLTIGGALAHQGATVGFYNTAPVVKPTVAGSRGLNAALGSLLTALAGQGLVIDSTTA